MRGVIVGLMPVSFLEESNSKPSQLSLAARHVVRTLLEPTSRQVTIRTDPEWGYPELVDCQTEELIAPCVSLTHTKNLVAAALASRPIGIDTEHRNRDVKKVRSKYLSAEEIEVLTTLSKTNPEIWVEAWCAKEAASKAVGAGIRLGLTQIKIDFSVQSPYPTLFGAEGPRRLSNAIVHMERFEDHVFAVCGEKADFEQGLSRRVIAFSKYSGSETFNK